MLESRTKIFMTVAPQQQLSWFCNGFGDILHVFTVPVGNFAEGFFCFQEQQDAQYSRFIILGFLENRP